MWKCMGRVGSGEVEKEHHCARHPHPLQPKPLSFLMLWMLRGTVPHPQTSLGNGQPGFSTQGDKGLPKCPAPSHPALSQHGEWGHPALHCTLPRFGDRGTLPRSAPRPTPVTAACPPLQLLQAACTLLKPGVTPTWKRRLQN